MNWSIASILVSLGQIPALFKQGNCPIGDYIRRGANAFLAREYKLLAVFVLVVAALIFLTLPNPIGRKKPVLKPICLQLCLI